MCFHVSRRSTRAHTHTDTHTHTHTHTSTKVHTHTHTHTHTYTLIHMFCPFPQADCLPDPNDVFLFLKVRKAQLPFVVHRSWLVLTKITSLKIKHTNLFFALGSFTYGSSPCNSCSLISCILSFTITCTHTHAHTHTHKHTHTHAHTHTTNTHTPRLYIA